MRIRKPRHSKQNVLIRLGTWKPRTMILSRERYTDMINRYSNWAIETEVVCIIPYPSPDLFNKE